MNPYLKVILIFLGMSFLVLGFIGLFLPILQGILFIIVGIYILSLTSSSFKRWTEHHIGKYPRIQHHYHRHRGRVDKFFKRGGV